jgi:ankyrin repeat protein
MFRAARFSNQKVVRMLLDRGAVPCVRNLIGMTPLHLACLFNNIDIAKVMHFYTKLQLKSAELKQDLH